MKRIGIVLAVFAAILVATIVFFVKDSEARILTDKEVKQIIYDQYPGEIKELSFDSQTASYKVKVDTGKQAYEVFVHGESGEVQSIERTAGSEIVKKDTADEELVQTEQEPVQDDVEEKNQKEPSQNSDRANDQQEQPKKDTNVDKQQETPKSNAKATVEQPAAPKNNTNVNTNQQEVVKENTDANKEKPAPKREAMITHEEVKRIALNEFPGTITDLELDEDDGRMLYEVEIENNEDEATIEIDAYTGQIIMIEIDLDD